jgi:hypothetical protein
MLASTFRQHYKNPKVDPYRGSYKNVLAEFVVLDKNWKAEELAVRAVDLEAETANAYVGLFQDPDHPPGSTRLVHAPRRFAAKIGVSSPYDYECFAILDDVTSGLVQVVEFGEEFFACTGKINVPTSGEAALAMWLENLDIDLLPAPKNTNNKDLIRVTKVMYVPAKYIDLFMGRRLTPRQLMEEVYPVLAGDEGLSDLKPLVQWMMACGMATSPDKTSSPVLLPDVKTPVADANFLSWTKSFLDRTLPGLCTGGGTVGTDTTADRMVGIVAQLLQEQQNTVTRTSTTRARSVSDYFKPQLTAKLMMLCDVEVETDLPEVWSDIATSGGKRDRDLIETAFRNTATDLGTPDLTPVVTPNLAKKITGLRFVGADLDNLNEGINPFSIVIVDHSTSAGEAAYKSAMDAALDYDDLMAGTGVSLIDLKAVKNTGAVVPETPALARAMLKAFHVVLVALLGDQHPLVRQYSTFLAALDQKENFFFERLQKVDGQFGPARLLRFIHLHTRAWFSEVWNSTDHDMARAIPPPPFLKALRMISVDNMNWLPQLPYQRTKHQVQQPPRQADPKRQRTTQLPFAQVSNPKRNPLFEQFRTNINATKFNEAINKVGPPPVTTKNGKEVQMCASYHLRGSCKNLCPRAADHSVHSPEEDHKLFEWCTKAFE